MRIAAGVLLIILAIANISSGVLWGFLGGVGAGAGDILEQAAEQAKEQNQGDLTDAEIDEGIDEIQGASGILLAYGFGQIALAILEFVAAIFCFTNKNPMIVMVAGIAEIALSIGVIFTPIGFGFGVWIGLGLVTGGLAIAAANQMKAGPGGPGPDPNMMAGNMPPMG